MTTVQLDTAATQPQPLGPVAAEDTAASAMTADFDTFLRLLTAELSNQDPLNPLQSKDFLAQLATFSAVEQQVRSNVLLERIANAADGGISLSDASAWIGLEAAFPGPAPFDGITPIDLAAAPSSVADRAVLRVTDGFGNVVAEPSFDPRSRVVRWDGLRSDGSTAPAGEYSFELAYGLGGTEIRRDQAAAFSRVAGATIENGVARIVSSDGRATSPDTATAVRSPAI